MKRKYHILETVKKSIWQFTVLEYFSYLVVFLIPLYLNYHHWMAISIPKQLLLTAIICVMLVFYAWGKWRDSENLFQISWIHILLVAFLGILSVSALLGVNPKNSFFGTWQSNLSLLVMYSVGIFGFFIASLVRRNNNFLPRLLSVSLVSGAVAAFITYFGKYVIRLSNDGSTVGNNSYLGAYLLLVVSTAVGIFFWCQKIWQRILIALGILIIIISPVFLNRAIWSGAIGLGDLVHNPALLLGAANGAAIGLGIALLVMGFLYLTRNTKKYIQVAGVAGFLMLMVGIWIIGVSFMKPDSALHQKFVEEKTENRFIFWDIAQRGFVDKPLLGYGINNYSYIYQKYVTERIFRNDRDLEIWVTRPHNIFWEHLSEGGILGALAFCSLIGGAFIQSYLLSREDDRLKKIFGVVFAGALFGYTFQNIFVFDTLVPLILFFTIIGSIAAFSRQYTYSLGSIPRRILLSILVLFSCIVFIVFAVLPWRESVRLGKLSSELNYTKLAEIRNGLQEISLIGSIEDSAFITDRETKKINEVFQKIPENQKPLLIKEIDSLINDLEQQMIEDPDSFRAHLAVGNLNLLKLMINKDKDRVAIEKGIDHFTIAHNSSPANPMALVGIGNLYAFTGDVQNARKYLRAAIAIAPTFPDGYVTARAVMRFAPNKVFDDYIISMEKRWIK